MANEKCQTPMKSSSCQRRRVWLWRSSLITLGFPFCWKLLGTFIKLRLVTNISKLDLKPVAVMLLKWAVILSAFVAASFGRVLKGKRSDFSMYDNQFSKWVSVDYLGGGLTAWSTPCNFKTALRCYSHLTTLDRFIMITSPTEWWVMWWKFRFASSNQRTMYGAVNFSNSAFVKLISS